MAKIFLTKVWGFTPEDYPALGFSEDRGRRKFLKESSPGDWVVLAGTRQAPTPPHWQGRLLGRVQLGTEVINVEEVLRSIGTTIPPDHYSQTGRYRWPFGLPMISAERFSDAPDLRRLFGSYLGGSHWAAFALDLASYLGDEAVEAVEKLRTERVNIAEVPAIIRQRVRQQGFLLNRKHVATGPGPSPSRAASERSPGAASAYVLRIHGAPRDVFKVGYASDLTHRLEELNKGLVPSATGCSRAVIRRHQFESEMQAYRFEQILHQRLRQYCADDNQEIYVGVEKRHIESVWDDELYRARYAVPRES